MTGLNEAFVVDRATRDRLIAEHPSSAEVLKPSLRGRDVKRWRVDSQDLWLIFTRRGINIRNYPAIHEYLKPFKKRLMPGVPGGRKPGRYEWYEIQDTVDYWREFEQPKVIYPDIYEHQSFAWDTAGFYAANTTYFIPTKQQWLTGLLNSACVEWFYGQICNRVRGGYLRAFSDYMRQIPIPLATPSQQKEIVALVDKILALKRADPSADVSALEHEIDERVYRLYGLTPDEIKIVEEGTK
ncbi:MAG TPA: TaqI-like C-terminal specificity domain-containing protein [Chthonomonadales bacterium]|nr:TaqI-like C-terminal specificity domain-containing protein [Chthonomonadales bacterium]